MPRTRPHDPAPLFPPALTARQLITCFVIAESEYQGCCFRAEWLGSKLDDAMHTIETRPLDRDRNDRTHGEKP